MRRTLLPASIGSLVLVLLLSGCAPADSSAQRGTQEGEAGDLPVVLASFSVLEDMASAVGGDRVDTRSITPPGAEVHEYSPTPGDLRDTAEADLILFNGLGLEAWYEQFLTHTSAEVLMVSEGVQTLPVTRLPSASEPTDDEAAQAEQKDLPVNPHAWMSPAQAMIYVDNIEAALSELSPADADTFAKNAEDYRGEIRRIWQEAAAQLDPLQAAGPVHLVSCEGAFSYLAQDLGLSEHYLWPLNAEDQGSPQQVEAQIRYVTENQVPAVFCESTVNDAAQQQVAESTDAELSEPLHVDSITEADGPAPSYLELLQHDLDLIIEGAQL
ncbi:metal ABC transporter solute-binding protein, Zn/Mn family [Nesterenkonia halotolerans]|uniref:Manganese transport system substrate-binding protein n=1 Tax=Nesterenkonia halotolerans TaxID=225325 RepID=A0ABR9J4S0_9MICC|nr:zinc ABC transporter substrate-binding protein [Nesterenkonia halotolerans]MBE1513998.1 manganese transport system substrate-binding protein [Nesterenkonia halotolerans]